MRHIGLLLVLASALSAQQVRFPVVVLDRDERFIKNLNAGHFRVTEDGVVQTVQSAEIMPGGISLGVVADKSNSLHDSGPASQNLLLQGLVAALNQSAPEDDFFVVLVSTESYLACDFTRDPNRLMDAFEKDRFGGATALWDGLYLSISHLERARNSKRAILVVSDGDDNNSRKDRTEIAQFLRRTGTPLFAFNLEKGPTLEQGGAELEHLARESGGWYKQPLMDRNPGAYILWVRDFLRAQYTLSYTPTKPGPAGKLRKVKVQVAPLEGRKGVKTVAPAGYFAP